MTGQPLRYYAGIGSRETPSHMLSLFESLASALGRAGYTLRSGGADGADTAFETGARAVQAARDIYLPWSGFNDNDSPLHGVTSAALDLAKTVHPRWDALGQGPRKLHARNCFQVLGRNLDTPSDFVVCWTPDGCETEAARTRQTGGTATGIILALRHGVPVFNLRNSSSARRLNEFLAAKAIEFSVPASDIEAEQGSLF